MKSRRTEVFLIILVIVALGAGVVTGVLARQLPLGAQKPLVETAGTLSLGDELQLSPEQRDQMKSIWEGVRWEVQDCYHEGESLQRERDRAIVALLDDRQKAEFEKMSSEFAARFTELTEKREQTFQRAVERTKKLLDDRQRGKYEAILKSRLGKLSSAGVAG